MFSTFWTFAIYLYENRWILCLLTLLNMQALTAFTNIYTNALKMISCLEHFHPITSFHQSVLLRKILVSAQLPLRMPMGNWLLRDICIPFPKKGSMYPISLRFSLLLHFHPVFFQGRIQQYIHLNFDQVGIIFVY